MIDDRTPNLNLPLPNEENTLAEDVGRLRSALSTLDTQVNGRQPNLGFTPENATNKGAANGYAGLDSSGKIPSAQLPGFVDDVLEFPNLGSFPGAGETGKLYIAMDTGRIYRWSGSAYVWISPSPGSTDDVPEGLVNQYFTNARARAAQFIATSSVLGLIKVGSGLSISGDGTLSTVGGAGGEGVPAFNELVITPSSNGQTVFTPSGGYDAGEINLYLNGVLLYGNGEDYTASDGVSITLSFGVSTTDLLLLRRWTTSLSFPFSALTDKPTTLLGFGVTDAVNTVAPQLTASADLNTVVASGFYRVGATPTNGPPGATSPVAGGHLVVSAGGSTASQIAIGNANGAVFIRTATGIGASPTWTSWRPLALYGVDVTATTGTIFNGQHLKLTNAGLTTLAAPSAANAGDRFRVSVMNGRTDNVINWSGLKHENLSDATMILDGSAHISIEFEYQSSASYGWKMI